MSRYDTLWKLLLVASIELAYVLLTRLWLTRYFGFFSIEWELCASAVRVLTMLIYWKLFQPLILSRIVRRDRMRMPSLHFGIALLLLVPVYFGNDALPGFAFRMVSVLTSFVVALREEMVYRAIVQNLLEEKLGRFGAIMLASIAFALYHFG